MKKNELLFMEQEVWPGMEVIIHLSKGLALARPPVFKCFEEKGAKRFFLLDGKIEEVKRFLLPQPQEEKNSGNWIFHNSFEGFFPDVRFSPIWQRELNGLPLPPNTRFAVFQNGKELHYEAEEWQSLSVAVLSTLSGKINSDNPLARTLWQKEFSLPKNVVLVPISGILACPPMWREPF